MEIGIKADNLIYAAEKIIEQAGDRLDGIGLQELEARVLEVKAALASGDGELVKSRARELQELVKELYTEKEVMGSARTT